ncbi:exopolyphosphatase [Methylobacterium brachythecii]|uniref:Exopolyphosphatase n=1 Tax=Methylobacterium brachythecii TaxID=1176177 RepID=A0A7W6APG9_9HYPH|nr:exopolyphosphatase [Methylobacterium brachythecii]MBB3904321.1 nanoRNase/pAp phosphatase (c-di-AMP/oligoRNAs hydrolase) [Methylobacterium brachythecii]GLS46773.1 exopolyphosphatase [Methylobacterium brachythecii]
MSEQTYRLVTRSDFDGLVCGMLLREAGLIDDIKFVHPKDMQDGIVPITDRDIITNLPYVAGCHMAFDHHSSEAKRAGGEMRANHVIDPNAPSAARVVYDYYGGAAAFPKIGADLMAAVDKADSAQFSREEILDPKGWVLMNFLMDSRTGLGRFRSFRISNYELMMQLIENCRDLTVEQVLALPDVQERVEMYMAHRDLFRAQLQRCARTHGKLVVLDLRDEDVIYAGNRFMIYALFPECDISAHVMWGMKQQNTVFAIGKSILDRGSAVDVGSVCLGYGGGGHKAAGTCQIANDQAERVKNELIAVLNPMMQAA